MGAQLSCIITTKDKNDPKLKDLLYSIEQQTYRNFETIIVTEGNSESAKAIGLKRANGKVICILASDNYLNDNEFFEKCLKPIIESENAPFPVYASYPHQYYYYKEDNILNRYFALFGVNDPIPFYLKKADKFSYLYIHGKSNLDFAYFYFNKCLTFGDNGFFIRKDILKQADIEHYYHIDVIQDIINLGYKNFAYVNTTIWHRTGGNIFKFFLKRFRYADKFSKGRRWHMVERKDLPRLFWFIISTLTLIYPLYLSVKGYKIIKDRAWFLHLLICLITIGVYGLWVMKKSVLSFAALVGPKALKGVLVQ